jgi:SAM-dependent methyltransferase
VATPRTTTDVAAPPPVAMARTTTDEAAPPPVAIPRTITDEGSVDIDLDDAPVRQRSPSPQGGSVRAETVALADDDLEDLAEAKARRGTTQVPVVVADEADARPIVSPPARGPFPRAVTAPMVAPGIEPAKPVVKPAAARGRATSDESGEIEVDVLEEEDAPRVSPAPEVAAPPRPAMSNPSITPPAAPGVKAPPPAPKKPAPARATAAAAPTAAPAEGKKGKKLKPWFEDVFDEDFLRTLPFLTPAATQAEAQFVIDVLGAQPGAQLLDLGCGYGRHAMELAARGFHVVGLDLSLPLLLRGADEAQRRSLNINFVHADMRELDFDSQFDGIYCWFSTFGYFDDESNKKTAANMARALKPGGRAVIEVLNRDYIITELPTRVWWEGDGCVVLEEVEFNYFASRIQSSRSVVFDDGRQNEQEITLRSYSLHEIGKLLHAAGFKVVEVSGSIFTRGRFFGHQSRHLIVVVEKRTGADK